MFTVEDKIFYWQKYDLWFTYTSFIITMCKLIYSFIYSRIDLITFFIVFNAFQKFYGV